MKKIYLLCFSSLLFFTGCNKIPTPEERKATLMHLVDDLEYQPHTFQSQEINLFGMSFVKHACQNNTMNIYIEGDGLSWINKQTLSDNPTPLNPLALKLMIKDKSACKIYLARPCQYTTSSQCEKKYWSSARFHTSVIDAYIEILDSIKKEYKNNSFKLIGYSGGGAIATLISAKRDDIRSLITVAGNLDIKKWSEIHRISPLYNSLNPTDFTKDLDHIPQTHYVGKKDNIIPLEIFKSYQSKFTNDKNIKLIMIDATHTKGVLESLDKL
ncbi:MAG: alpha/beta hydrolase [Arcobacteraceae bacterium]